MTPIKDRIQLVEITEVENRPGDPKREPHWKVTLALTSPHPYPPTLQATWYMRKKDWPDASLLPGARHWMNRLCRDIAEATDDWALEEAAFQSLKRPPPTPQS